MPKVLLIFIDGLGLGADTPYNPLVVIPTPGLRSYLEGASLSARSVGGQRGGALLLPLDSCLGVEGLPQSATGQATLFTGINAPALLGYHLKGFPNGTLKRLLKEKGIFGQLKQKNFRGAFANAFRPFFFEALAKGKHYFSCSTAASYYGGLPFRSLEDVEAGRALYADITNEKLKSQGYPVTVIRPSEAAFRLAALADAYDFTLFEYFLTDLAAHRGDPMQVFEVVSRLDKFLGALRLQLSQDTLLLITSDHGNIEDMVVKGHTLNPVPALIWGPNQEYFRDRLKTIADVAPAINGYLASGRESQLAGGESDVQD
jgi:2,3-bisphosphoglycerate-independent phosphoglycerate mutase